MITPELIAYIKSQLALGVTKESLLSTLSTQGWQAADIQEGFNAAFGMAPGAVFGSTVVQPVAVIKSG